MEATIIDDHIVGPYTIEVRNLFVVNSSSFHQFWASFAAKVKFIKVIAFTENVNLSKHGTKQLVCTSIRLGIFSHLLELQINKFANTIYAFLH